MKDDVTFQNIKILKKIFQLNRVMQNMLLLLLGNLVSNNQIHYLIISVKES